MPTDMKLCIRLMGLAVILGAGVGAYWCWHSGTPKGRPGLAGESSIPYGLEHAAELYYKRGGRYVWGKNDCSMFLTDYLKAHDVQFPRRLTTKEMVDPKTMRSLGMREVKGAIRPGDVVVYRFRNGKEMGHCGVVLLKDGELEVVHNSGSMGGLAVSRYRDFVAKAGELGARPEQILAFRPMQ